MFLPTVRQAQLVCDLNSQGKATGCSILKNGVSITPMTKKFSWDESDPVVFQSITLNHIDNQNVLKQFPTDMQPRLRVISGQRICRGIFEAIFINQRPGYTLPVILQADTAEFRVAKARGFMKLVSFLNNGPAGSPPDILVDINLVNTPDNLSIGRSILSMPSTPITISFLSLYYETKKYIYNMNTDRIDQCFRMNYDMPIWSDYNQPLYMA